MLSPDDPLYDKISDSIFLDGKITSAPWMDIQSNKFFWDISFLPININESRLQSSVLGDNKELVTALKCAHFAFDSMYLDGSPAGVLTVSQKHIRSKPNESHHITIN